MLPFRRWLRTARMLPPLLSFAAPLLGPWLARRRFPRVEGSVVAAGLHAPVDVIRDRWGVPHLFAKDEHDLFFAQGYVHAQDRLFQMELGRRVGEGTMSAALGPPGIPVDRVIRTLGLRRMAERAWSALDAGSRAVLEAYAEGVNARLDGDDPLPVELTILGFAPTRWSPIASLVLGNVLALMLSGNYRIELLRAALVAEGGEALADLLLPPHAPETPTIVPPAVRKVEGLAGVASMAGLDGLDRLLGDPNIVSGSNNWVVHGSRTATGKPLLANDVHIGLGLPSTWYENGLHGGRFDGVGFSLPGVPLLVLGHNGRVAWGMSNLGPDTQDFYLEKLDDPVAPRRYEWKGEWHDLEILHETIEVRGEGPVALEIRSTRHGPIMNEAMSRLLARAEPMALRWALGECAPLLPALIRMNLAKGWDEFRAALALWDSPGQNFVYADVDGNVGYQATGKIPIRAPGHRGIEPVAGWTGDHEWQGFIPFDELPRAYNPDQGFLATANNKVTSDDYPYLLAHHYFPGYRAKRITDLLAASDRHTVDDMRRIHAEVYSLPAEALRPHLLALKPEGDLERRALAAVAAWDLRYEIDRAGATVFQAWYATLLRNLLAQKLGPALVERYLASEYERHGSLHMPLVIKLLSDPDDAWFRDPKNRTKETREEMVRKSFVEALAWLGEKYGPDPEAWTWGRAHTLTMTHAPLGRAGPALLRRLFNSKTIPARGDNYTVDGASFLWNAPFTVVHGTAQRMIIDLDDLSRSVGIHTPGQSEHLHHPHREDLMLLSQEVGYHPLLFTREAVEEHAESRLTLLDRAPG
jgi:penicillin G amidase